MIIAVLQFCFCLFTVSLIMVSEFIGAFVYEVIPMCMCFAFVRNIHIYLICIVFTISLFWKTFGYVQIRCPTTVQCCAIFVFLHSAIRKLYAVTSVYLSFIWFESRVANSCLVEVKNGWDGGLAMALSLSSATSLFEQQIWTTGFHCYRVALFEKKKKKWSSSWLAVTIVSADQGTANYLSLYQD